MHPRRILIAQDGWIYLFSSLSGKDKKELEDYFGNLYPRDYVKKLVASIEDDNVQLKKATISSNR